MVCWILFLCKCIEHFKDPKNAFRSCTACYWSHQSFIGWTRGSCCQTHKDLTSACFCSYPSESLDRASFHRQTSPRTSSGPLPSRYHSLAFCRSHIILGRKRHFRGHKPRDHAFRYPSIDLCSCVHRQTGRFRGHPIGCLAIHPGITHLLSTSRYRIQTFCHLYIDQRILIPLARSPHLVRAAYHSSIDQHI